MNNNNINTDKIMKDILAKSTVILPSVEFTNIVMNKVDKIEPSWKKAGQPLISRKVWIILTVVVTLFIIFVVSAATMISGEGTGKYVYYQYLSNFIKTINIHLTGLVTHFRIPLLLPIGLGFILIALFVDSVFRKLLKTKKAV
jgi:hypothetical protein